jgi:hypothetical protein
MARTNDRLAVDAKASPGWLAPQPPGMMAEGFAEGF